ncbi:MAG: hypothetical protein K6T86_08070 [Pirellulales bacterium]|nr:hypothetical protein [Pirellulales bacterium]
MLLGACQLAIAWRLVQQRHARARWVPQHGIFSKGRGRPGKRLLTWWWRLPVEVVPLVQLGRSMLVGVVVCYFLAVSLSELELQYVYPAVLAVWYTVSLAVVALPLESWQRLLPAASWPAMRWLGRAVTYLALAVAGMEAGLRLLDLAGGHRMRAAYLAQSLKLPAGSVVRGRTVNSLGYWDDEFDVYPAPGTFRIAAVGRGSTLWARGNGMLALLEQRVPGVEVYNFGLAHGTPREYAAQLAGDVATHHPHLVLVFISTGEDLVDAVPAPAWSSIRSLRLYQVFCQWVGAAGRVEPPAQPYEADEGHGGYEAYLNRRARTLALFRAPIDAEVEQRWQAAFDDLRRLIQHCRQRDLPLAVVLVPDELQYRPVVRDALCRRVGCRPAQLDLELPQRRLVRFAQRHDVPTLDLLPYFRASDEPLARPDTAGWTPQAHRLASDAIARWLQMRFGGLIAAAEHRAAQHSPARRSAHASSP